MRNRLVITLCAVVSLLAGAGLLTFWLVRSLAPAAALNYTPWPLSPEPDTQADLDEALALRTAPATMEALAAYAGRLPAEFGVLLMRDAVRQDPAVVESEPFARWARDNAEVLM